MNGINSFNRVNSSNHQNPTFGKKFVIDNSPITQAQIKNLPPKARKMFKFLQGIFNAYKDVHSRHPGYIAITNVEYKKGGLLNWFGIGKPASLVLTATEGMATIKAASTKEAFTDVFENLHRAATPNDHVRKFHTIG